MKDTIRERIQRAGGTRVQIGWSTFEDITDELIQHGIRLRSCHVQPGDFWQFVDRIGELKSRYFSAYPRDDAALHKGLEHFVSLELLAPRKEDVVIDIASCNSPFPEVVRRLYGASVYRHDLWYEAGLHGDRIGGNASHLPLPAGFADKLVMHCSFEHFEDDSDSLFVQEAARVLRPGGLLCILPLYTNRTYRIQTDLAAWGDAPLRFEPDALVCVADGWAERFGRVLRRPALPRPRRREPRRSRT